MNVPGSPLPFRVFGGLTVRRDGGPIDLGGRKQRAVLAVLAVDPGRLVPADELIDRVWGSGAPPRAEASLQAYVSKLRRLLEPGHRPGEPYTVLVTEPGGYRLRVGRSDVDVARFEDLVAAGGAALSGGDPAAAAADYEAALDLYGPLLPELASEPWVAEAAARLEVAHADALEGAFEARLALGGGRDLIAGLEAAVAAHPFRERLRGLLALALYRAGRQTDALRSLAEARRTLAEEIGVEPGPELRALEADILAHAPHLMAATSAPPATPSLAPAPPPAGEPPAPAPSASPGPSPVVPASLAGPGDAGAARAAADRVGLVGREAELGWLVDAARHAAAGEGRAVVITGEPGIGKTRLAEELVEATRPDGMVVVWARCLESASSAPFWGYTQIAEQLVAAGVIGDDARQTLSAVGGGVHTIDPAADRLALHDAMVAALRTSTRPLLIVVDDLQWADASSLRALEFVAGALRSLPVLIVATVRSVGPDAPAPLVSCLAELVRQTGSRHVDLHGLSPDEVATWLSRRRSTDGAGDVARVVHERTGGNPFFVGEFVELLARQDQLDDSDAARRAGVPAAALDVVRRRVSLLPGPTQQLLSTASVLGLTIDLDVLAHVAGLPVAEALDTLDPAAEAGLLVEDRERPGRLRFAHALVADALAAELSLARRARLHAAVVAAIEHLRSASLDDHLPTLVHHGREGALAGTAPQAFAYALRAADLADDRVAFETAAAYADEARRLLDLARPGDRRARYDVLVRLGAARMRADDLSGAHDVLLEAIAVAEDLADAEAARRAADTLVASTVWQTSPYGEVNEERVGALERVLARLGDEPTPERARLLGALSDALYYAPDPTRSTAVAAEAVDVARRAGDPATLVRALQQQFLALWRGLSFPEQRRVADEMVDLAGRGDAGPDLAALAHHARAVAAIQQADRATFEHDLARARRLADRAGLPGLLSQVGWTEVGWLVALGRYDEADERARATDRLYRRARGWEADDIVTAYGLAIAHDRGTLPSALDAGAAFLDGRFGGAGGELLAWMLTENGELDRARELVGPVGSVPDPPRDWLWLGVTTAAAHVRAALGDRPACAVLYERLAPLAGGFDVTLPFLGGIDLALTRLAEARGDLDAARRHAAAAVGLHERLGTRPGLARTLHAQARLLAAGGDERAAAVVARARAVAREVDLAPVLAALDRADAGDPAGPTAAPGPGAAAGALDA